MFVLFWALGACAGGALAALLHPLVLLALRRGDAAARTRLRHQARFSGFILCCALARALDLSFAGHVLNLAAVAGVMVCAAFLVVFAFRMAPRTVGVAVGLLAGSAWLGGLIFCLMMGVFGGNSAATVQLDDGLVCRETVYGFVTSDSGEIMDIYRRYLFVDHRLLSQRHSDVEPEDDKPPPAAMADTLARCRMRVNAQRAAMARR